MSRPGMPIAAGGRPHIPTAVMAPRADPVGAALLLLAGFAGILQLVAPWRTATWPEVGTGLGTGTGYELFQSLRNLPDPGLTQTAASYAVLAVGVGGGALVLLGLLLLAPMDHRPMGTGALLVAVVGLIAGCLLVLRSTTLFGISAAGMFTGAQAGWYLFLACGVLGLFGAVKALATG